VDPQTAHLELLGALTSGERTAGRAPSQERGQLLSQASGMQSAQRIADIVKLLESLPPAERRGWCRH